MALGRTLVEEKDVNVKKNKKGEKPEAKRKYKQKKGGEEKRRR
jgi:hypothetical protein